MSNSPTPPQWDFDPKLHFEILLDNISQHPLHLRKPDILPHLQNFLTHPDVRALLHAGGTPPAPLVPSPSAELKEIRTTLKTLTQAIASIQKPLLPPKPHQKTSWQ